MGHSSIIAKMNKLIHEHIILAVWEWIQVEEEKTKIKKKKKITFYHPTTYYQI